MSKGSLQALAGDDVVGNAEDDLRHLQCHPVIQNKKPQLGFMGYTKLVAAAPV